MAQFTADRKKLVIFLKTFGEDIQDILLKVRGDDALLEASVGTITHFLRARLPVTDIEAGDITINDLPKVLKFIGGNKSDDVIFLQESVGKTLYVTCGNSKMHLPSSSYVRSQKDVSLLEKMVKKSEDNMWTSWISFPLNYSGTINSGEMKEVMQMSKVLGEKTTCKMDFYTEESELLFRAGKKVKGQMFVKVPVKNVSGPPTYCTSTFGYWLPKLLQSLPTGEVDLHTGADTVMTLRQDDSYLLVVMDQDYEED